MNIGIVGHEAKKFTARGEAAAREVIRQLLQPEKYSDREPVLVSGRSPLGGIDVWAEEEADRLGLKKLIYPPKTASWADGFKPRNLKIAHKSDFVHVIVATAYPAGYSGMKFDICYHCVEKPEATLFQISARRNVSGDLLWTLPHDEPTATNHKKSGGCWTARQAEKNGAPAYWHFIEN